MKKSGAFALKRWSGFTGCLHCPVWCTLLIPFFMFGCSYFDGGREVRSIAREANGFFNQGNYEAALSRYRQLLKKNPGVADRVLFEMGIIEAHPGNPQKDYQKATAHFRRIVRDYPDSKYRHDSQMMVFQIQNGMVKDQLIAAQKSQIDACRQKTEEMESENLSLRKKKEKLIKKLFDLRAEPVQKVLIEKGSRRLTLLWEGEAIKTYKIALGGNPVGPKERQGDNKTPEGNYTIESRNRDSRYHLSLRISYPNEKDKKRARERGHHPGGDIMIHGIRNGFSSAGAFLSEIDWTRGCIAVTNEEIEEIERLVPNGTPVEIRP